MFEILAGSGRVAVISAAGTVMRCLELRGRIAYESGPGYDMCCWMIAMRRRSFFECQTVDPVGISLSAQPKEVKLSDC